MSERASALDVVRRGWRASPELRAGAGWTLVLALVAGGGRVVVPVLVQQMLDRGLRAGTGSVLFWSLAGAGVAAVVVTALAAAACRQRLARAGESALATLRTRAFRQIHRLSLATQTDERRGALVSRVTSDVDVLSRFLTWAGVAWLVNTTVMAAVLVVMVVYDWRLAVVSMVAILPMALVLAYAQRRLSAAYTGVREAMARVLSVVSEAVLGHPVIRSYGAEELSLRRVTDAVHESRRANVRAGTISAFMFPSSDVFSVLTVAAVLVAGVAMGPDSGLTVGKLVAFLFLTGLFLEPVAEFTEIVDETQTAVAGWRRVLDVLAMPVEVADPDPGVPLPPGPPAIDVEHVSFEYQPGRPVLLDVCAHVPPGARAALVGATGSGKTTLAKLLTRLADPGGGRILVGGVDLREVEPRSLRSALVLVPQEGFLFDGAIVDNVRFGRPAATDEEVRLAFVELGLESWLDGLPHGLGTRVGQRGEQLSVGERQLVSLARAYVANPSCLILDEATSAVDPATEVRINKAVESLSRGRTSVTIAHRLATAERSDLVLVMDEGRLVEQGSHAELVTAGGVYAGLHERWVAGVEAEAAGAAGAAGAKAR